VLHEPDLIILDEPFSGFDPVNAQIIQKEILELNQKGATIIYSTHRMESVEELCDYIALINKSEKVLDGSVSAIKRSYKNQTYLITYKPKPSIDFQASDNSLFDVVAHEMSHDEREMTVRIAGETSLNDLLLFLIEKIEIQQVREIVPSMHDIFIDKVTQISTPSLH